MRSPSPDAADSHGGIGLRWRLVVAVLSLTYAFSAAPLWAAEGSTLGKTAAGGLAVLKPVERPVDDELVLEMRIGDLQLTDAMLGFLHRGGVLLPLGQVMEVIDFPIFVDPAAGQAEGWFLAEDRRFSLDLARGEVLAEGRRLAIPKGLAEIHIDDIYVDTTLFAEWFPVKLEFNLSRLSVVVTSDEPLPIEQRLAREKLRGSLGRSSTARRQYPVIDLPRKLIDTPFIDISSAASYDSETDFDIEYSALVTGDLLYLDADLFIAGDKDDIPSDVRLTLGRKDPDGRLLGPVKASEFAAGDVFTPQIPLVSNQVEGRGATVSTFPLFRPSEFDRTTLRGELPLGWEVELYRNEVLLDFQASRADGRYEFTDVPLVFGSNVLRLVFYGPQGQRREEVQRFLIGTELIKPGTQYWRIAANQDGKALVPVGTDNQNDDDADGTARFFAEYERGLTQNLSVASSVSSFALSDGKRRTYGSLGLRTAMLGSFMRLDAARNTDNGTAVQGSVQTDIFGVNLLAEHARLFDFESERVEDGNDRIESLTDVRVDAVIPSTFLPRIPVSLTGSFEERESGRYAADLTNRLSVFVGGVSASNTLEADLDGGGDSEEQRQLRGGLLLNSRFDRLVLRGELDYDVHPDADLSNVALTADYLFDQDLTLRGTVSRQFSDDELTTGSAGAFFTFENFALGANGTYSDDGRMSVGISLSFGIGREPRTGSFAMRGRGMADDGAASAQVFLDRNANRRFDEGDKLLPGVGFERQRSTRTDDEGLAFLTGLPSYQPVDIAIDPRTLEDPFWVPQKAGVRVVPRPGKTVVVDFPVVPTGEIDGTVVLRRGDVLTEVANVALQLLDSTGAVVKEAKTEFDGFFLFDRVTPGDYRIRVAPAQAERLKLKTPPPYAVAIDVDGNVVSNIDLVVERAARFAAPEKTPVASAEPGVTKPTSPDPGSRTSVPSAKVSPKTGARSLVQLPSGDRRLVFIQLAAMQTMEGTHRVWAGLRRGHRERLGALTFYVEEARTERLGKVFRLLAGPFEKKAGAARLCADLTKENVACLLTTKDTDLKPRP